MLVPSLICLTIWIWSMISTGGLIFPWPIFVILGTGGYLSRLVFGKESAIEEERERLRKKQARSLTPCEQAVRPSDDAEVDPRTSEPQAATTGAERASGPGATPNWPNRRIWARLSPCRFWR